MCKADHQRQSVTLPGVHNIHRHAECRGSQKKHTGLCVLELTQPPQTHTQARLHQIPLTHTPVSTHLDTHSEIQGSTNALGPSPASPTTPAGPSSPNPRESQGDRAASPSSAPPGDTRPAGPRRPSSGSKPLPALSASADFPATCNYSPDTLSPNTNRLSHRRCFPHPGGLAPAPLPRPQPLSPRGPPLRAAPAVPLAPLAPSRSPPPPPPHLRSPP